MFPALEPGAGQVPASREELVARNRALMANLRQLSEELQAAGQPDRMQGFKQISMSYQKGQVSSMAYFSSFRQLFGADASRSLFPELVLLLPDAAKRAELTDCYTAFSRQQPQPKAAPQPQPQWGGRGAGGRGAGKRR